MSADPNKKRTKSKAGSAANSRLTSQLIAEQTRLFLKAGGKIVKIRSGAREELPRDKE